MLYLTSGPKETEKLAGFLLKKFLRTNPPVGEKKALVIALEGELGAGKTVFVKGIAKSLKLGVKIKSPTFVLMREYRLASGLKSKDLKHLYHLDCYRLRDHRDFMTMGIKEVFDDPRNIVLIEWADRIKKILPKKHTKIHIDHISKNERKITLK